MSVILLVALFTNSLLAASSGVTYNVVLPSDIKALRGSCVQIPCSFNVSDFEAKIKTTQNIFGIWLKGTHAVTADSVVFNSSKTIIRGFSHIEMLGNLSRRECTTVFYDVMNNHSNVYYFRVQMEMNVFRATFDESLVNITVMDAPNPPELKGLQEVMEGTAVNLTCSAEAPCPKQPPTLSWSNIPESANITTQLQEKPDKTQSVFSRMTFIASYIHHRQNISCTVTYSRNNSNDTTVNSSIVLKVLFPPKETHVTIQPSASVSVGTNVTLTCRSKANPSNGMNFTWYKQGEQKHFASGKQLSFSVCRINGGWYFCRAENKHGEQTSEKIELIVKDVPNPPELNGLQEVMEGTAINLTCSTEAPCPKQPPTLSWSNIPKSANITTQLQEKPDKTQSVFSRMTFIASYIYHRQNISCTVTYSRNNSNDTTVNSSIMLQVLFSPKETHILTEPSASVSVGTNVTLTCKSKASPSNGMNFTWYKRGEKKHLASGERMTFNVNRINGGWYLCTAENKHGAQTSEEIQLIVEESSESSVPLIAGCAGGVVAFLLLLFIPLAIVTRKQRTQSSNNSFVGEADISDEEQKTHVQINSIYINSAFVSSKQSEMPDNESDVIHYGEINFSTLQPKPTTDTSGQETVYAKVCNSGKKMNQD